MMFCFGLVMAQSHSQSKAQTAASKHPVSTQGSRPQKEISGSTPPAASELQPVTPPPAPAASASENTSAAAQTTAGGAGNQQATDANAQQSTSTSKTSDGLLKTIVKNIFH